MYIYRKSNYHLSCWYAVWDVAQSQTSLPGGQGENSSWMNGGDPVIGKIVYAITDLYLMSCVTHDNNQQKFVPERCKILFIICHWDNQGQLQPDQCLLMSISVQRRANAVSPIETYCIRVRG